MTKKKIDQIDTEENLYLCLYDPTNKRKNLLNALKNSLIMQEEAETALELRKEKTVTLKLIKKNMDSINSKYQEIKKHLPTVKNSLNFTKQEISELDSQIENLKQEIEDEKEELKEISKTILEQKEEIELDKQLKSKLKKNEKKKSETKEILATTQNKKKTHNRSVKTPTSKLDRIKNNLSLIESKLNKL